MRFNIITFFALIYWTSIVWADDTGGACVNPDTLADLIREKQLELNVLNKKLHSAITDHGKDITLLEGAKSRIKILENKITEWEGMYTTLEKKMQQQKANDMNAADANNQLGDACVNPDTLADLQTSNDLKFQEYREVIREKQVELKVLNTQLQSAITDHGKDITLLEESKSRIKILEDKITEWEKLYTTLEKKMQELQKTKDMNAADANNLMNQLEAKLSNQTRFTQNAVLANEKNLRQCKDQAEMERQKDKTTCNAETSNLLQKCKNDCNAAMNNVQVKMNELQTVNQELSERVDEPTLYSYERFKFNSKNSWKVYVSIAKFIYMQTRSAVIYVVNSDTSVLIVGKTKDALAAIRSKASDMYEVSWPWVEEKVAVVKSKTGLSDNKLGRKLSSGFVSVGITQDNLKFYGTRAISQGRNAYGVGYVYLSRGWQKFMELAEIGHIKAQPYVDQALIHVDVLLWQPFLKKFPEVTPLIPKAHSDRSVLLLWLAGAPLTLLVNWTMTSVLHMLLNVLSNLLNALLCFCGALCFCKSRRNQKKAVEDQKNSKEKDINKVKPEDVTNLKSKAESAEISNRQHKKKSKHPFQSANATSTAKA